MNYPPYWGPPPFYMGPPTQPQGLTLEQILLAEDQIKRLKDGVKKELEDKKEKEKKGAMKPPSFSLGAVFGILSIGSIPFVLLQLAMLDTARVSIAAFLKVPTP